MPNNIFAAIDVGSSQLSMKIYTISKKNGIKEIEHIRYAIRLGSDTYQNGKISVSLAHELCQILNSFVMKMKEYDIKEYTAYATSAIGEASNSITILDQIRISSGLKVTILSNSQQRFLCLKAIALQEPNFSSMIEKGAALIDVGSGSTQISLFQHGVLQSTQNIQLGTLRMEELLGSLESKTNDYENLTTEYVSNELVTYYELFMLHMNIETVIIVGTSSKHVILKKFLDKMKPKQIYYCPTTLCDGIVVDYAAKKKKLTLKHNFSEDILSLARNTAKRYHCNEKHIQHVEHLSLQIFDSIRKIHGLGKRERFLLQLAVILHNCGDYINMNRGRENTYHIIKSTELLGLSDLEQEMVANIVRYTPDTFPKYSQLTFQGSQDTYLIVSKLFAIFAIANALDKSHRQKFSNISVHIKENILTISVNTLEDITLEYGLLDKKAEFFQEVYGIRPCIIQKRS